MADDIQLLRHYAETHANEAFRALVERHISLVYSAALRQLGGAVHRAEDVTQTVFVLLARQAAALSRRDDIVGWLFTTTHHTAARLKRTELRRQRREQEAHIMHELLSETLANAEWERLRPVLDDAMLELNERDRRAILLRFFKNEGFVTVGQKLGLSEDAARMRVDRALDKLHALLAKRGITSTSAALGVALANEAMVAAPAGLVTTVTSAAVSGTAVGSAGLLAAGWYFMSASKITLSLAAAGVLAAGFTVYQSSQANTMAMEVQRERGDYAAVRARVATLEAELKAAEQEKAEREAVLARIAAEKAAATTAARTRQTAEENRKKQAAALEQFLGSDPELLKLRHEAAAADYRSNFAWRPNWPGGKDRIEEEARKSAELAERNDVRQQAGLEIEVAPKYSRNPDARAIAAFAFANWQYHLEEPYSREQAARLESILVDAQISREPNLIHYAKFDWDKVVAEASSFLSPAQLEVLRAMQGWGRGALLRREVVNRAAVPATK